MKLAVVCDCIQFSDLYYIEKEDSMKSALESMARDGYEITLFAMSRQNNFLISHNGVDYNYSSSQERMVEKLKAFKPDGIIIKSFTAPIASVICNNPCFRDAVKLVIFCGGKLIPPQYHTDYVMVASEEMGSVLASAGYPAERIIPSAFTVDTDLFCPTGERLKYDLIYVADWRENKRQMLIIEAMKLIPALRVCFLGAQTGIYNQEYFEKCMMKAEKLNIRNRMILVDRMPGRETVRYYQQSQMAIHLGMATEGGARSPLEAMSCELPVICAVDCLSNTSRIGNLQEGYHCSPDAKDIAHAIQYLQGRPEQRREMGQRARQRVLRNWPLYRMEDDFRRVFPI